MVRLLSPLAVAMFGALLLVGCGSDGVSVSSASTCDELAEAAEGPLRSQTEDALKLLNNYEEDSFAALDQEAQDELDEEFSDILDEDFDDEFDDKAEELDCDSSFLDDFGCELAEDLEGDADTPIAESFLEDFALSC